MWFNLLKICGITTAGQHPKRDDSFYPFLDPLDKDNSIVRNLNHKTFCNVYRNELKQTGGQDKMDCSVTKP